jgi:hypothetical protein
LVCGLFTNWCGEIMALVYDSMGNVIGEDSASNWDSNLPDANIGIDNPVVKPQDVGYLQQKVNEFQNVLTMVDATATALENMLVMVPDLTEAQVNEIQNQLTEFYNRKSAFKFAAESFNAVASMVNGVGGSLSQVNIPQGLGFAFAPLVIPFAWAAAIAGAAILVSWAMGWQRTSASIAATIAQSITDPVQRDAALSLASQAASSEANSGGSLGSLANIVKYAAVAGALYIGYKMYVQSAKD